LKGEPLDLTAGEFKLLHFLAQRPGLVFSRSQIVDAVRGEDYPVTERAIDVQIWDCERSSEIVVIISRQSGEWVIDSAIARARPRW
jgi:DNA-binding response OmpR family regulator